MIHNSKKYYPIETRDKITIADSFVCRSNKLGTANGEAKLYVGNESPDLRNFFGEEGFKINCFLVRDELIRFLSDLRPEYMLPQLQYRGRGEFQSLYNSRLTNLHRLPMYNWFTLNEQVQIGGPRVYVKSQNHSYELMRELSLPNLSYASVQKLISNDGDTIFHVRLFADYMDSFGTIDHPAEISDQEALIESNISLSSSVKIQTVKARIGQGKYRQDLLKQCPFCPITLVSDDRLLIASHIKPWAVSDSSEKIDPKNGFMLTPTADHLFDSGFITFEDTKKMIISPWLSKPTIQRLNLRAGQSIEHLPISGRERYLDYHRKNIFKS
jgi:hypothetical protein